MKIRVNKSIKTALCVCAGACLLSGCATQISTLGNWDNTVKPTKEGSVSHGRILGIFGFGDLTLDEAMQNGNIQKIHHTDLRFNHWLSWPIYREITLKVYGE